MSRILVLGGYGGFGARLARRLIGRGHHVLVAGRSIEKAEAFARSIDGAEGVAADRSGDMDALLARHRPDLLIDAAGPFQGSGYDVPIACVRAGIPYLDLADGRDFVIGIDALDAAARAAGVAVVSGASSVPALSGAVARALAAGLDDVRTVDVAISASNRATAGPSVAAAILSTVGRPIRLWRGGRWSGAWAWQQLRRQDFVAGDVTLRGRWLALVDVPDHVLMPDMLPGRPAATFRAGTEIALQTIGLWLLSWPVRWLSIRSLARAAPLLRPMQQAMRWLSSDRSAMSVRLTGSLKGAFVERTWVLIAEQGDGPEIPTLAAAILSDLILAGKVPAGARHAGASLSLDAFAGDFESLAVRTETRQRRLPPPLYARIMGGRFDALPPAVREIHQVCGDGGAVGEAEVVRGKGLLARLIASAMRFPPAGHFPLHVGFRERGGVESWTRDFGGHRFTSHLRERRGRLVERFGPLRFRFDLPSDASGLEMRMTGWSVCGLPLPMALAPRTEAREWQQEDRFHFDVAIALPMVGPVVHYRGWLKPVR